MLKRLWSIDGKKEKGRARWRKGKEQKERICLKREARRIESADTTGASNGKKR